MMKHTFPLAIRPWQATEDFFLTRDGYDLLLLLVRAFSFRFVSVIIIFYRSDQKAVSFNPTNKCHYPHTGTVQCKLFHIS